MKHFELIIFDLDGLLIDSERIAFEQFLLTEQEFGIEVSREAYFQCIGANAQKVDEIMSAAISGLTDFSRFKAAWREKFKERIGNHPIPVKDGALDLIHHIKANRQPMAVATSTETLQAKLKLTNAGLLEYVDAIIGGEQVSESKPAPDIFLKAAELFQIQPARCLVLEDSENGVNAALTAGMTVVQIPDLVASVKSVASNRFIALDNLRQVISYPFTIPSHVS